MDPLYVVLGEEQVMRLILVALFFMVQATFASADVARDVRQVISQQMNAFQQDDFEAAFEFASPSIQSMFQTSENFGRMVRQGYPMVWRPRDIRFLDLREMSGGFAQVVQVRDGTGRAHFLRYYMVEVEGRWRIGGVEILKASDFAA